MRQLLLSLVLVAPAAPAQTVFADGTGAAPAAQLDNTDVAVRATYRFTEYPERACPAAEEYARRGLADSKAVAIRETILPYCRKRRPAAAVAVAPAGRIPTGRYVCLRLGSAGNRPADDLTIGAGGRYAVGGGAGTYSAAGGLLTFASGPWATVRSNWVARFVPAGPEAKEPTLVIRDRRDVAAGNRRDLQWCNLAR